MLPLNKWGNASYSESHHYTRCDNTNRQVPMAPVKTPMKIAMDHDFSEKQLQQQFIDRMCGAVKDSKTDLKDKHKKKYFSEICNSSLHPPVLFIPSYVERDNVVIEYGSE